MMEIEVMPVFSIMLLIGSLNGVQLVLETMTGWEKNHQLCISVLTTVARVKRAQPAHLKFSTSTSPGGPCGRHRQPVDTHITV